VVRKVRKGTETDEELITTIDELQVTVDTFAATVSDGESRKALSDVYDALGRLEVAIDAAGPNYRFDPVVKVSAKSLSFTGLTAALILDCTPG